MGEQFTTPYSYHSNYFEEFQISGRDPALIFLKKIQKDFKWGNERGWLIENGQKTKKGPHRMGWRADGK